MTYAEMKPIVTRLHLLGFTLDSAMGYSLQSIIHETLDIGHIARLPSIRNMYLSRYNASVKYGRLVPIEQIDHFDKLMYWHEAEKYAEERQLRKEMAIVLYTINYLCIKHENLLINQNQKNHGTV